MAEEQVTETIPVYGYSKDEPKLFNLKPGKSLPKGYYMNPAMVPGSDAEKQYRQDAAREGAPVPWDATAKDFPFTEKTISIEIPEALAAEIESK